MKKLLQFIKWVKNIIFCSTQIIFGILLFGKYGALYWLSLAIFSFILCCLIDVAEFYKNKMDATEKELTLAKQMMYSLRETYAKNAEEKLGDYWNSCSFEWNDYSEPDTKLIEIQKILSKFDVKPKYLADHFKVWILGLINASKPNSSYLYMHWQEEFSEKCPTLMEWQKSL